jgi:4-aminobutyrate aminotransferase-like enzyme
VPAIRSPEFWPVELLRDFGASVRYFNTFGGDPVSIAAALAVLDVLVCENPMRNAQDVGAYLKALAERAAADERLGAARGAGLFIGVDVKPFAGTTGGAQSARIVNQLRERRVLISASGPGATSSRFVRPCRSIARRRTFS